MDVIIVFIVVYLTVSFVAVLAYECNVANGRSHENDYDIL
jgi:hypothetical protein